MTAFGPDFLVNFTDGIGDQTSPSVTALNDGRFVVVWQTADPATDGDGTAIMMQIYNPDGSPLGNAQLVNTATGNDQRLPVVAALDGGGFAIAWESALSDGGVDSGIRARVYDATGTALANEFLAHTNTAGEQTDPAIVALDGGGFAIAWTENAIEAGTGVRARLFDSEGNPVFNGSSNDTNEFHVNQGAQNGDQEALSLAAMVGGGFVATWRTTEGADTDGGIKLRTFAANGVPTGTEILVNDDGSGVDEKTGNQRDPSVTVLTGGRFVVTWASDDAGNTDGDGASVMYRVFNSDDDPETDSLVLSSTITNDQQRPVIAATPDGGFVAVWMDDDGGNQSIRARLFDEDGVALANDFVVNIGTHSGGLQSVPTVTVLPDGRIVVAWQNDNTGFDGNGTAVQAIIFHTENGTLNGVTVGVTGNGDDLTGSDFDDVLNGGAGGDDLVGGDGDDFLNGRGSDDTLDGGTGNDMLDGGAAGDIIDGGDNTNEGDTLTYANNAVGVWAYLNLGVASGGDASYDKISNVENVHGTQFDDTLVGDDFGNVFVANGGKNTLEGNGGDDLLQGGSGIDTISGGDGDDLIDALDGADIIDGGTGFDILSYTNSAKGVTLTLGANGAQATASGTGSHGAGDKVSNVEAVFGTDFNDSFTGNNLDNTFAGGFSNDILKGGDGNDMLDGGDGADSLDGGNGDDLLKPGDGVDTITGAAGNDTVSYDVGTTSGVTGVTITLGLNGVQTTASGHIAQGDKISLVENVTGTDDVVNGDTITGNNLDNIINGLSGPDVLDGGGGINTLSYEFSDPAVSVVLGVSYSGGHAEGDVVSNFHNIIGGRDDDSLTGDAGNNVIQGHLGSDTIDGGAGDDTIDGGATGSDDLDGGSNTAAGDTISYASATSGVTVGLSNNSVSGAAAGDTIKNFENVTGSEFNDLLSGLATGSKISGGGGNDLIFGSLDFADTISGGDGDDEIIGAGGTGTETLDGGKGIDTLSYEFGLLESVTVTLVAGQKAITSGGAAASVNATGFENITGTGVVDKLTGDTGANLIRGGNGADVLDGGAGIDTLSYVGDTAGVTVTLNLAAFGVASGGGHAAGDTNKNFENIIGGSGNDTLIGNSLNNVIEGGIGDDTMDGGAGIDTLSYENLVGGANIYLGNTGEITLNGGSTGNDIGTGFENLIGTKTFDEFKSDHLTKATVIDGRGGGDDIIGTDVAALSDKLIGGDGDDEIDGRAGADTITGDAGDDKLVGGAGNDIITGGTGDDVVTGGAGADNMDGGAGYDTLKFGGTGTITVNLAANTISGASGSESIGDTIKNFENINAENMTGGKAVLTGTAGYNEIRGGLGDDVIEGGAAGDKLDGDAGSDTLSYANSALGVTIDFGISTGYTGDADGDTFSNFELFVGSKQNDRAIAAAGIALLDGNSGDDLIVVSGGATLLGGANGTGGDTLDFSALGSKINADLSRQGTANATRTGVTGGSNNGEVVDGYNAAEFENLIGTALNDKLTGNAVANVIEGGAGADEMDGAAGVDTLTYRSSAGGVNVELGLAVLSAAGIGGDAAGDKNKNFENLIGSEFTDANLAGNTLNNKIEGLGGDDYIFGGLGIDTLLGGDGDDNIMGHVGADIIDGGAGFDYVSYTSGDETVGITITLGKDGAKITASGGHAAGDQISNVEHIIGSAKNDVLTGNNLANELFGGDGDDKIQGLGGDDTLSGDDGTDTVSYALSALFVNIDLNLQNGILQQPGGGDANGDILSNFENVTGTNFNDILIGDAFKNTIDGGAGDDFLNGNGDEDILVGGTNGAVGDTVTYVTSGPAVTVDLSKQGTFNATTGVFTGPTQSGGDAQGDKLSGIENLIGTDVADTLTGSTGNNVIEGGAGGDTLDGGAHATGGDTLSYASSNAGVNVLLLEGINAAIVSGGHAAGDQAKNFENIIGSANSDVLEGNSVANVIKGGALNDLIRGGGGFDTLFGEAGIDDIFGDAGADVMDGGDGFDILHYDGLNENITLTLGDGGKQTTVTSNTAGAQSAGDKIANFEQVVTGIGNDVVTGSSGQDKIFANDGNDTIRGGADIDELYGDAGDDTLEGGAGADYLDGGTGLNDTVSYASSDAAVTVNLGFAGSQTGGHAQDDTIERFEHAIGSAFNDNLTGSADDNKLSGGGGNDTLTGNDGADTLDGGLGNDHLYGEENADTLNGGDGNDRLEGGNGVDTLSGGIGDDTLVGGADADILKGEAGLSDTLSYEFDSVGVTVTLKGTLAATIAASGSHADGDTATGFENLTGGNAIDKLTGDTAANIIRGGDGNDILDGGTGNDTIDGGDDADTMDGGVGTDTLSFESGFVNIDMSLGFALTSGGHIDFFKNFENVIGSNDADTITGDAKVNKLEGGKDNDQIFGGDGNDIIIGGTNVTPFDDDFLETSYDWKFDLALTKGADNVSGGAGNDSIGGGLGNDTLDGGDNGVVGDTLSYVGFTSIVSVVLGAKNVVTSAKAGAETDSIKNFENVIGGSGNDTITGNEGKNILSGDEGDDTLTGNGGDDLLIGDTGDDVMVGGKGADTFDGDRIKGTEVSLPDDKAADSITGFDTVLYGKETGTGAVSVNLATGQATDTFGDTDTLEDIEVVFGSAFNDTLTGSDILDPESNTNNEGFGGLRGNDIIDGGPDLIDNHDEVRYDRDAEFGGAAGVTVNLTNSAVVGTFNGKAINIAANTGKDGFGTFDTLANIEGIRGTAQADFFFGTLDNDQGLLKGLKGADYISGSGDDFADYSADGEHGGAGRTLVNLSSMSLNLQATATTTLSLAAGKGFDGFNIANTFDTIVGLNNIQGTNSVKNGTHELAINDVLVGNSGVNIIRGFAGNDSLAGLDGSDILDGGDGAFDEANYTFDDQFPNGGFGVIVNLSGATESGVASNTAKDQFGGIDTLISIEAAAGSEFDDEFYGGFGANRFYGYKGEDLFDGTADVTDIDGVTDLDIVDYSRDSLLGGSAKITVNLSTGEGFDGFDDEDELIDIEIVIGGRTTADKLTGGNAGNVSYEGFAGLGGIDTIDGAGGFDEALYYFDESFGGTAGIVADLQLGTIRDGFGATDVVTNLEGVAGTSKVDSFKGALNGSNTFRGFNGADTFNGNDTGNTGADTINYSTDHEFGATHGIIANLGSTTQIVDATLIGKNGTISVAGNRVYDSFSGTTAIFDIIALSGVNSTIENVTGTKFNDVLIGSSFNNVLLGGEGNDTIFAGGGDTVDGGDGIDHLITQGAVDTTVILGGNLQQGLAIGSLNNIENVTTGDGADLIHGDALVNVLSGGKGNDILIGYQGADTLNGGDGTDTVNHEFDDTQSATHGVIVNLSSSTITIGNLTAVNFGYTKGDIFVESNTAYDAFNNDPEEQDIVFDTLISVERAIGTKFDDILVGGDAINRLSGGLGADKLTGGAGGDGFQYKSATEGGDTITDFVSSGLDQDFIRISRDGFNFALNDNDGQYTGAATGIMRLNSDDFVVGTAADQAHAQFVYDNLTGDLFWDDDGTGGNVQQLIANFENLPTLDRFDFLLIPPELL